MTLELFIRSNAFPSATARRFVRRFAADRKPAEIGVEVGGTLKRPRYRVTDAEKLRRALLRHAGPRALAPASTRRIIAAASAIVQSDWAPADVPPGERDEWRAKLRADLELLGMTLPER
ncbi:MAG: hypothetical protein AAGI91_17365 [Bacteroidota bacterium]